MTFFADQLSQQLAAIFAGAKGVGVNKGMIDPIWEYHHDVGKSITGGGVYRGKALPELEGYYLCADYVSSKIWALKYDEVPII